MVVQFGFPTRYETLVEQVPPRHLVHPGGEPITNIHAFDANGDPVTDIFLYDGGGRPIEVRRSARERYGVQTDYERAADGTPLRNWFPLRQYIQEVDELGNERLLPRPAPRVVVPPLVASPAPSEPPATAAPSTQPRAEATRRQRR